MNRRDKRFAIGRAQLAFCLMLSLLLNLASPTYLLGGALEGEAASPNTAATAEIVTVAESTPEPPSHFSYLPTVMRAAAPLPDSPGDGLIVSWAQVDDGGTRDILLHWRTLPSPTMAIASPALVLATKSYAIDRRVAGEKAWETVGHAGVASNAEEMEAILGADLVAQLGYDLSGDPKGTPLSPQEIYDLLSQDPALVQVLAQAYYQVGLAFGASFVDEDAPRGVTLEYQVRDLGPGGIEFEPASVPVRALDIHPPFSLRETWEGPDGLGQAPSDRPANAPERYSWQTTSEYMAWDGKVYLIWDTPNTDPAGDGRVESARLSMNVAGYRVYRSPHGRNRWSSINPTKTRCVTDELCEMLVGVGPQLNDSAFPPYHFVDNLHESALPATVYDTWDYKVCAVDALRNDIECSEALAVDVRELQPPIKVQNIEADVPEDQSKVTITWTYSDTSELSPPLRFYVTRSPTLTAPMEDWTVVKRKFSSVDYFEIRNTGPARLSVTDYPPRDQVYWYRVQVRDDAGNWSCEGNAVEAARYTRTPPELPRIPYDSTACERNPMPLGLTGLDDNVFIVNLYRSFDPSGPYQLIKRFEVTQTASDNYVEISDDFVPPYPTDAYYRLEAVDDHGNVSSQRRYCAELGDAPPVDPGAPTVSTSVECDRPGRCQLITTVEDDAPIDVVITLSGEDGVPITSTATITGSEAFDVPAGGWISVGVRYADGDDIFYTWHRVLDNEFLDTDRGLEPLGPMNQGKWITDTSTTPPEHYVRLRILDGPTPPIAVFRRAEHGNWMQIGPVSEEGATAYEDRSDPSPDERYDYVVIALSPVTYEMLGYWGPITVEPLINDPPTASITSGISPVDSIDGRCDTRAPATPGPDTILLQNGWEIQGPSYWIALRGNEYCPEPSRTNDLDLDHAYGSGTLTNGVDTWSVEFQDITIDAGSGQHLGGRIVATLDETRSPTGSFKYAVRDVEFTADNVRAEADVRLPETIKVEIDGSNRTDTLFGVFPGLTTDLVFDAIKLGEGAVIVDENLPWKLHSDSATIDETQIKLAPGHSEVGTSYRFVVAERSNELESNLAFMSPVYKSDDATVRADGLTGHFVTSEPIEYLTSFPGAFLVSGDGATLSVVDDQIVGGQLTEARALLSYESNRAWYSRVVKDAYCNGSPRSRYSLCLDILREPDEPMPESVPRILGMHPIRGNAMNVGPNGYLSATVTMDQATRWPSFETDPPHGTLFIAPAAFPDEPTTWHPMPAEAAWQRLPDPDTGGTFDPGLNLNSDDVTIDYYAYPNEPQFPESTMNLYVRKGGVSGHIVMVDESEAFRTNVWGYKDDPGRIEMLFLDNFISDTREYTADLLLPYPTDATLPVHVENDPVTGYPSHGSFREAVEITHSYWSFTETPRYTPGNPDDQEWIYADADPDDYTLKVTGVLTKVLQFKDSEATVHGLQPADATPDAESVAVTFNSEWLPDGDIGALRILPSGAPGVDYRTGSFKFFLTSVKLSRYYSDILDPDSDPSTLGIDLVDTMDELPEAIVDDDGNLTPQTLAECAATTREGCGLIVLDGDITVDYFGEVERAEETTAQAIDADIPGVDELLGRFPIAVNCLIPGLKFLGVKYGHLPWIWPVLNDAMEVDLPVKILGSAERGVVVGLLREASIFPNQEIFRGDVAAVIDVKWVDDEDTYTDTVGVLVGYGASQAAFRALAMNRPTWSGEIKPYDDWNDVRDDIEIWATKFGYTRAHGIEDDPVDLAEKIWDDWGNRPYNEVFDVLAPVLNARDGDDAFGVTGLEAGSALGESLVEMRTATLSAIFRDTATGLEITQLEGAGQAAFHTPESDPFLFQVDWITFRMDRDGQIEIVGDGHCDSLTFDSIDVQLDALATPVGDEWRFEGSLDCEAVQVAGITELELDSVFGLGPHIPPGETSAHNLYYWGGALEARYLGAPASGAFLAGRIQRGDVILEEKFLDFFQLLDINGVSGSYEGLYAFLSPDFTISGTGSLEASADGTLQVHYSWDSDTWEAVASASVDADIGNLLHGRGRAYLEYSELELGDTECGRTCEADACVLYCGYLWAAAGLGSCSPSSWDSWDSRWWGDSWCYTVGAYADQLGYIDPPGEPWDCNISFESEDIW